MAGLSTGAVLAVGASVGPDHQRQRLAVRHIGRPIQKVRDRIDPFTHRQAGYIGRGMPSGQHCTLVRVVGIQLGIDFHNCRLTIGKLGNTPYPCTFETECVQACGHQAQLKRLPALRNRRALHKTPQAGIAIALPQRDKLTRCGPAVGTQTKLPGRGGKFSALRHCAAGGVQRLKPGRGQRFNAPPVVTVNHGMQLPFG